MDQGFSVSFVGVSLILLLWFCVIFGPRCSAGLPELAITDNPEIFGSEDQHKFPILTVKADGSKYFQQDWLPHMSALASSQSFQTSDFVLIRADARLSFGEVRKTLDELKKYRTSGIVLMSERKIVEPKESRFQEYLLNRSMHCNC